MVITAYVKHLGNIMPLYNCNMGEIFFSHILEKMPCSFEQFFSEREMRKINRLYRNEKRVRALIKGRYILKDYFGNRYKDRNLEDPEIEILNQRQDHTGKIFVALQNEACREKVSVSYAEDFVCVGVSDEYQIGVDLEKIHHFSDSFLKLFFSEEEHKLFQLDNKESQTRLWCIKEAVLKAIGTGFEIGLKNMRMESKGDYFSFIIQDHDNVHREAYILTACNEDIYQAICFLEEGVGMC